MRSDRLLLREIHMPDWPAFHCLLSDPETVRFLEYGPFDEPETRDWLAHVIVSRYDSPRLVYHFAIELPHASDNGDVVGWIAVSTVDESMGEWALSFALARSFWGRGIMTEAAGAVSRFALGELGARRVVADCDAENGASARVLEKAGFASEGVLPEKQLLRARWRQMRRFVLTDWSKDTGGDHRPRTA